MRCAALLTDEPNVASVFWYGLEFCNCGFALIGLYLGTRAVDELFDREYRLVNCFNAILMPVLADGRYRPLRLYLVNISVVLRSADRIEGFQPAWFPGLFPQKEVWAMRNFGQNYSSVMSSDISAPGLIPGKSVTDLRSFVGLASTIQPPFSNHSTLGSLRFLFLSRGNITSVTSCETSTTYVDVQVSCTSKGALGRADCGADAVCKIPQPAGVISPGFLDTLRINGSGQAQEWQIFQARKFLAAFTDLLDDDQR